MHRFLFVLLSGNRIPRTTETFWQFKIVLFQSSYFKVSHKTPWCLWVPFLLMVPFIWTSVYFLGKQAAALPLTLADRLWPYAGRQVGISICYNPASHLLQWCPVIWGFHDCSTQRWPLFLLWDFTWWKSGMLAFRKWDSLLNDAGWNKKNSNKVEKYTQESKILNVQPSRRALPFKFWACDLCHQGKKGPYNLQRGRILLAQFATRN